jgi:hypothetical protein
MPPRRTVRTVVGVMHSHPDIHAELARQRQAELVALARSSRAHGAPRPGRPVLRFAPVVGALRRLLPTTNKETCDAAVRHFAS